MKEPPGDFAEFGQIARFHRFIEQNFRGETVFLFVNSPGIRRHLANQIFSGGFQTQKMSGLGLGVLSRFRIAGPFEKPVFPFIQQALQQAHGGEVLLFDEA